MDAHWFSEFQRDANPTSELLHSSDEENEKLRKGGGSRPGKAPNVNRRREEGALLLCKDYFSPVPTYSSELFERRFRVTKDIYDRVCGAVCQTDSYFLQRQDCLGKAGLSTYQKSTAAFRSLAYGRAADSLDEYLRISESTAQECLKRFARAVVDAFGSEYLRYRTVEDMTRILANSERRGLPGVIGSIDCCKWEWKNCPTAWHGQYQSKEGEPCITLEAIADEKLWIWHAIFWDAREAQ